MNKYRRISIAVCAVASACILGCANVKTVVSRETGHTIGDELVSIYGTKEAVLAMDQWEIWPFGLPYESPKKIVDMDVKRRLLDVLSPLRRYVSNAEDSSTGSCVGPLVTTFQIGDVASGFTMYFLRESFFPVDYIAETPYQIHDAIFALRDAYYSSPLLYPDNLPTCGMHSSSNYVEETDNQ